MKKKTIIELVILVIIVLFIGGGCIYFYLNKGNTDDYNNYNTYNEEAFQYEEYEDTSMESIGYVLATDSALVSDFCNGYGVVDYASMTYIINTEGEILAEFSADTEYGKVVRGAYDMNFYEGRAIFISEYGTLAIPIEYDGTGEYFWSESKEFKVICITEENLLVVTLVEETPEGSITKIGVQDSFGNWVIEAKSVDVRFDSIKTEYLGNYEYLIDNHRGEINYYYNLGYYSYNVKTGAFIDLGEEKPEIKKYYKDDYKYIDQIDEVSPMIDGVQVITIRNDNNKEFVTAVDENGNQLFEPIRCLGIGEYSEGLLGVHISAEDEYGEVIFIDKNGTEHLRIETRPWAVVGKCNSGIINGDQHYYDKEGNLLFE